MTEKINDIDGAVSPDEGGAGTGPCSCSPRNAKPSWLSSLEARHAIMGDDTLLTVQEVAWLLQCCVRHIYHLLKRRELAFDKSKMFPMPIKLHALSRWPLRTIKEWIENRPTIC